MKLDEFINSFNLRSLEGNLDDLRLVVEGGTVFLQVGVTRIFTHLEKLSTRQLGRSNLNSDLLKQWREDAIFSESSADAHFGNDNGQSKHFFLDPFSVSSGNKHFGGK